MWWQVESTWSHGLACGKHVGIHGGTLVSWWHKMGSERTCFIVTST